MGSRSNRSWSGERATSADRAGGEVDDAGVMPHLRGEGSHRGPRVDRRRSGRKGSALQRSRVRPDGGTIPAGQVRQPLVGEHVEGAVRSHEAGLSQSERRTWFTRRRVTPPISPASCSRVHRGQAASRSRASFSARVSCTGEG